MRIYTDTRTHASGAEVKAQVACLHGQGGEEITDGVALAIAAQWQSPGKSGRAFAELASTGSVDVDDLALDIATAYPEASPADRRALDMLGTWYTDKLRQQWGRESTDPDGA